MKCILITALLVFSTFSMLAQSVSKATDLLKLKKVWEAKMEIDSVLADKKNTRDAEAWYVKSKVYSEITGDEKLSVTTPNAREQSFEALKKYVALDNKKLLSVTLDNYKPAMDIYQGYFKTGVAFYNSANFAKAYDNFKKSLEVSEYMNSKGWFNIKTDTSVLLFAGISAERMNKADEATVYYKKLADAKVAGINMYTIYAWLVDYYYKKKDVANTEKYLALGKLLFPGNAYWMNMELDVAREKGNKEELFATYENIIKQHPDNPQYFYNYGIELYNEVYKKDINQHPANADELITKAEKHFKKALELKPDHAYAILLLGEILYNQGIDIHRRETGIKGPPGLKPSQQKNDHLKIEMMNKFDEAISFFEKIDQLYANRPRLNLHETATLKSAYNLLIKIYSQTDQQDKVKIYEEKLRILK